MQQTNRCMDDFNTTFDSYPAMLDYHQVQSRTSEWIRCPVRDIHVEPLNQDTVPYWNNALFVDGTSPLAVQDTAANLGLAMRCNGKLYPLRRTAFKSLLDRAKINGTVLAKLPKKDLAQVINTCLQMSMSQALVYYNAEKVTAIHSGDEKDYSVLPIDELLGKIQNELDERFPGNIFEEGYTDHSLSGAMWKLPNQKTELLETYANTLASRFPSRPVPNLMPAIQFITSDSGMASARVAAILGDGKYSIHIGSCVAVEHRGKKTVDNFGEALSQLFAQYGDNIKKLEKLLDIMLVYPVNAMTRLCKELVMPKKEASEAINFFEAAIGDGCATAHDVFMAMQEIPYNLRIAKAPESKILTVQENIAKLLSLNWESYDLARRVDY